MPRNQYPRHPEVHGFSTRLLEELNASPAVLAAALTASHPLDAGFTNSFAIVGRESESADLPEISVRMVSPGYFDVMGTALMSGRFLDARDGTEAARTTLINRAAAERLFPEGDPTGQALRLFGEERTIVGVVGNERFHGLDGGEPIAMYTPLAQTPSPSQTILVRTASDPLASVAELRRAVRDVDPALAVDGLEPLSLTLSRTVQQRRLVGVLVAAFAGLAMLLAVIGINGVLRFFVAQKNREIGIRMALGASGDAVIRSVLAQGMGPAGIGIVLGLAGAFAMSGVLRGLLYEVSPTDPLIVVLVAATLALSAALACYFPARRAAQIDPVSTLSG